jgi:hypothetical protein
MTLLSLLDCPLTLPKWTQGFTHGKMGGKHILDDVLLSWRLVDNTVELRTDEAVMKVYNYNVKKNPAYWEFRPLIEQGHPQRGFPTLDVSVLGPRSLAAMHMAGLEVEDDPQYEALGLLEDLSGRGGPASKGSMYEVGCDESVCGGGGGVY